MAENRPSRKDSRSVLRKAFDRAERAVATRVEPVAQSGRFASALSVYVSVNRKLTGVLGKATGGVLHLVKIPTTVDVSKLHQHLSSVDSHIAELILEMERTSSAPGNAEKESVPGTNDVSQLKVEADVPAAGALDREKRASARASSPRTSTAKEV